MKNYLIILLVSLHLSPLLAQIEFAPVGATYYYFQETLEWESLMPYIRETVVTGDTIIQDQPCRVLEGSGMNWPCNTSAENEIFMYQDSGRVYYFHHGTETFDLLYDFNKNEGESWEVPAFCYSESGCGFDLNFTVRVDSVSYVDLNEFSVKVQHVTMSNENGTIDYADIYEGLGDLEHLFFEESWHCTTAHDWIRGLRCYDSPTDGLFTFYEGGGTCDMLVAIDEIDDNEQAVTVFPNPASESVTVEVVGEFNWFLYDAQGRLMDAGYQSKGKAEIELQPFHKGFYFLKIEQENNRSIKKIIKE